MRTWFQGGKHTFITTFMKHIQFCILTGNEKENSSQIYHTCAPTIHLAIISHQCCVLFTLMEEIFPKEKVTKFHHFEHGIKSGVFEVG